jgi:hypothetical protein
LPAKYAKYAKKGSRIFCVFRVFSGQNFAILNLMQRKDFTQKRKQFAEKTIDELIELLSAEDLQTRFFAEMCLRDATST